MKSWCPTTSNYVTHLSKRILAQWIQVLCAPNLPFIFFAAFHEWLTLISGVLVVLIRWLVFEHNSIQ